MNTEPRPDGAPERAFDGLAVLRASGTPVDLLSTAHQRVLASLTEAEVAVLDSVRARLQATAGAEVEGQGLTVFL